MTLPNNTSNAGRYIAIFMHNKDQMYFPKTDEIYGSTYQTIKIKEDLLQKHATIFLMDYLVKRTYWKALDTKNKPCDTSNIAGNTTACITEYLENTIGCSIDLALSDPKVER